MLKIRLSRIGKKSQPSFRVVVQEHTSAVKAKSIEALGYYRPAANPKEFKVDLERVKYWLSVGAQPSDSMAVLLKKDGLDGMDKFISPRDKQRKSKKEVVEEAPKPVTAAPVAETPAEEVKAEEPATETAPVEEVKAEEPATETPAEEVKAEAPAETPAEAPAETPAETPAEEPKADEPATEAPAAETPEAPKA